MAGIGLGLRMGHGKEVVIEGQGWGCTCDRDGLWASVRVGINGRATHGHDTVRLR